MVNIESLTEEELQRRNEFRRFAQTISEFIKSDSTLRRTHAYYPVVSVVGVIDNRDETVILANNSFSIVGGRIVKNVVTVKYPEFYDTALRLAELLEDKTCEEHTLMKNY